MAVLEAARLEPIVYAVHAQGTLAGCLFFGVEADGPVRTAKDAELAPDAFILIYKHQAVRPFVYGPHGAKIDAGRVTAMETHVWNKVQMKLASDISRPDGENTASP